MRSPHEESRRALPEGPWTGGGRLFLNVLIVTATVFTIAFMIFKSVSFSYPYSYYRGISYRPLLFSACLISPALIMLAYTERNVDRRPALLLGIWYVAGGISQVALRYLCARPFEEVIGLNRFADFVKNHGLASLIRNYDSLSRDWYHPNVNNNMPGKGIMMKALEILTGNLMVRGILLILVSNLGMFLAYSICMKLFKDRKVAVYASILYLFLPARIFFLTQPNVITPVFILTSFLLFLLYLEGHKAVFACLFGSSLYFLMYFETTPLVLGIVFLAFAYKYSSERKALPRDLLRGLFHALVGFLLVFFVFLLMWDYNIVSSIILKYSTNWRGLSEDPYLISLLSGPREFLLGMGVAPSVLFLACCGSILKGVVSSSKGVAGDGRGLKGYMMRPLPLLSSALSLSLLALNLLGVNRVEITRTWIYMMVFADLCVASFIVEGEERVSFYLVLACIILQTAVSMSVIAYV